MISVILYGRNDSYGYNLHKRGVLSLNCIAELLDDPDDEILFVDYNTPDDLPSFVEAIADMLTPQARKLVRTLRVRPALHARFAPLTHLRCLESPARNAALRRSNPNNRWILATNTDMVFVPRTNRSLSAIAAELPDGFYHTARFEIPEILWETLDRSDPRMCIARIADWGKRFHLNEIVYGAIETLFDGPGDFQLFLRNDGFSISGFDERMLLGWHVDTNIAKRLSLLRGHTVNSALDRVFAYHCDHNRETTPAHAHGATQNSWERFVTTVSQSDVPDQQHTWGFPSDHIEEIRLDEKPDVTAALSSLLPPMGEQLYVTGITPNQSDLRYDPEHVLPYLANAIGALPSGWSVAYGGCRSKTLDLFAGLWKALGFSGKVLVLADSPAKPLSNHECVEIVDAKVAHDRADFFIFEMGAASDDAREMPTGLRSTAGEGFEPLSPDDYVRILTVHRAYAHAVDAEQRRIGREPRRFILVNMQNNALRRTATWRIGTSATPIGTRITHGFALADPFVTNPIDPVTWLQARLGGAAQVGRELLEPIVNAIRSDRDDPVFGRLGPLAGDLARVLSLSDAATVFGVSCERLKKRSAAVEERRFSNYAQAKRGLQIASSVAGRTTASRIAALEDFDDPLWGHWAVRAWGGKPIQSRMTRLRWIWQSTHVAYALDQCGVLGERIMLLTHPAESAASTHSLFGVLSDWGGTCTLTDVTRDIPGDPVYDAVVVSEGATIAARVENIPAVFAAIDRAVKPGGVALFALDIVLDSRASDAVDLQRLGSGIFGAAVEQHTEWILTGPLALELSAQTLDTVHSGEPEQTLARLDEQGRVRIPSVLTYRKKAATTQSAWERYYAAFNQRVPAAV
jgi:hypothetical protein